MCEEVGQKAMSDKEFLRFVAAWESDRVDPMKPLVEKYGWDGLMERLQNSVVRHD